MNLNEAINNLNRVLFVGRIEMPEGPLTAQEQQELAGNFSLLVSRAQLADKLEKELKDAKDELVGYKKAFEMSELPEEAMPEAPKVPDETPEVPDEEEVE